MVWSKKFVIVCHKHFTLCSPLLINCCLLWGQTLITACEQTPCVACLLTVVTGLKNLWRPCDLVQADLQTSSQRLNLSASNSAVAELKPECCIDDVIHHEVKEIGTHMWVFEACKSFQRSNQGCTIFSRFLRRKIIINFLSSNFQLGVCSQLHHPFWGEALFPEVL